MSDNLIKPFCWNEDKNIQLKAERGVSFESAIETIQQGNILDIIEHPNQDKYPSQRIFILEIDEYVYMVPFVENEQDIFLKTIIPSRKLKKKYLGD
jgi:uncharacterized DUF497 family protein